FGLGTYSQNPDFEREDERDGRRQQILGRADRYGGAIRRRRGRGTGQRGEEGGLRREVVDPAGGRGRSVCPGHQQLEPGASNENGDEPRQRPRHRPTGGSLRAGERGQLANSGKIVRQRWSNAESNPNPEPPPHQPDSTSSQEGHVIWIGADQHLPLLGHYSPYLSRA